MICNQISPLNKMDNMLSVRMLFISGEVLTILKKLMKYCFLLLLHIRPARCIWSIGTKIITDSGPGRLYMHSVKC